MYMISLADLGLPGTYMALHSVKLSGQRSWIEATMWQIWRVFIGNCSGTHARCTKTQLDCWVPHHVARPSTWRQDLPGGGDQEQDYEEHIIGVSPEGFFSFGQNEVHFALCPPTSDLKDCKMISNTYQCQYRLYKFVGVPAVRLIFDVCLEKPNCNRPLGKFQAFLSAL